MELIFRPDHVLPIGFSKVTCIESTSKDSRASRVAGAEFINEAGRARLADPKYKKPLLIQISPEG